MRRTSILLAVATIVGAIGLGAHADVAFTNEVIDPHLVGAAFTTVADINADGLPDPIVSSFGNLSAVAAGGGVAPTGSIAWYQRTAPGSWTRHVIADGIIFPNEPRAADIDGDGDLDVVAPGGFFACQLYATVCGSLSWFEQRDGDWFKHVVVQEGGPLFFHRAIPVDWNGDGRLDLVTVGETLVSAQARVYLGEDSPTRFSSTPLELGPFGGSLPVVEDVDGDGDLDIASAQFFMADASFAWLERVQTSAGDLMVSHTMSATEGGSIMLAKVPGIGWVGTNHTNTASVPVQPKEGVYLLAPGADPRLPWSAARISDDRIQSRPHDRGLQGAPGVFGWGDVDGDGDIDLGVSGDGDRRIFLLRNDGGGAWTTIAVADAMGQAGGGQIVDLDGDGRAEMLFSSYDASTVALFRMA